MLKSLQIKNYALIENLFVEFGSGLNIITGETGAGKSIIIGAMGLLLGGRASSDVVRKGSQKSIIEGIFDVKGNAKVRRLLSMNDLDDLDELILRREISIKGNNRIFVNDTPVNLSLLKEIGFLLVDLHGQHEHQSLLRQETHIEMLDEFGDYSTKLKEYRKGYQQLNNKLNEQKDLLQKESLLKEKKELYKYQLKEIDSVSPEEDEDEQINSELNILENAERILELGNSLYSELYESEGSIAERLANIITRMNELVRIDNNFSEKIDELENALALVQDVSDNLVKYIDRVELDPQRLEELRERLGAINLLKKKYGGSIKSVLEYREKIGQEFDSAVNFDERIESLEKEIAELRVKIGAIASEISEERKKTAASLQMEIEKSMKFLGIKDGKFEVRFIRKASDGFDNYIIVDNEKVKAFPNGADVVEFFISTNLGEDPKPLVKIASGGEVSRIMLALKTSLAKNDKLPLLIFDEIDTGVSGKIASKVGSMMKDLAEFHQIIAITHLPQIAALSEHHFSVYKITSDGRVVSGIKKLNETEKIHEVAKLISGEEVTENALLSAKELITN